LRNTLKSPYLGDFFILLTPFKPVVSCGYQGAAGPFKNVEFLRIVFSNFVPFGFPLIPSFIHSKKLMNALTSYLRGVRTELTHVVWPSQRRAITDVIAVILISAVTAALIAGLDYVFTGIVTYIVSH
jgi:preprotein translocase SecE subunit